LGKQVGFPHTTERPTLYLAARRPCAPDGFALLDALVALLILSITLTMAIGAAQTARQASLAAANIQSADYTLRALLDTTPMVPGTAKGRTSMFDWRMSTAAVDAQASSTAVQICSRTAELFSRRDGRRYRLDTAAICTPRTSR
jgi:Tfp pilus assembly protein PilV